MYEPEELGKQRRFVRVGQPHPIISLHEVFVLKITEDLRRPILTLVDRIGSLANGGGAATSTVDNSSCRVPHEFRFYRCMQLYVGEI
jgi:hypothetical protein